MWHGQAKGGGAGYSLASLSNDRKAMAGAPDDVRRDIAKHAKTSMKKLFGRRNLKKASSRWFFGEGL
jgi:hypothetical protein